MKLELAGKKTAFCPTAQRSYFVYLFIFILCPPALAPGWVGCGALLLALAAVRLSLSAGAIASLCASFFVTQAQAVLLRSKILRSSLAVTQLALHLGRNCVTCFVLLVSHRCLTNTVIFSMTSCRHCNLPGQKLIAVIQFWFGEGSDLSLLCYKPGAWVAAAALLLLVFYCWFKNPAFPGS